MTDAAQGPVPFSVPERFGLPFTAAAALPPQEWDEAVRRLASLPVESPYQHLLDISAEAWPVQTAQALLDALISLGDFAAEQGLTSQEAGLAVAAAARQGDADDDQTQASDQEQLIATRVEHLLDLPVLRQLTSAIRVLSSSARRVESVKVSPEVRPIPDGDSLSPYAILVHDLRLSFDEGGTTRSLNLTVDAPTLRDFAAAIKRALHQEKLIRARLRDVLTVLDAEGAPDNEDANLTQREVE